MFREYFKSKIAKFIKAYSVDTSKNFLNTFEAYFAETNKNQVSWIFDCIDVWGKHFSKVKFRFYEKNLDGSKDEVTEHPILNLFIKPNQIQYWWELSYRMAAHFAIYGNNYIYKIRNGLGIPIQLIQLIPSRLTPIPSRYNNFVESYKYNTGSSTVSLKATDIIHIRYPDPENLQVGKAIISNIMSQVEVEQFQLAYLKQFYKMGGFLGNTWGTSAIMSNESFKRAVEQLRGSTEGIDNSYRARIFDSDLRPIQASYSMKDMDVKPLRDQSRDEICAAFQVNKFMLGMAENINRATAQEVSLQFASGVIEPMMNYIDTVLTYELAHEYGLEYCIEHDNTSPRDQDGELAYYKSGIENGWLTPNEVREWESLKPIELDYMNAPLDLSKTKLNSEKQNAA